MGVIYISHPHFYEVSGGGFIMQVKHLRDMAEIEDVEYEEINEQNNNEEDKRNNSEL